MASIEFGEDISRWGETQEARESQVLLPSDDAPLAARSLASAVDELSALEDQLTALARDARNTVRSLATSRVLRASGYASREELESRMILPGSRLELVLACLSPRHARRSSSRARLRSGPHLRDGRALEAIAGARKHLRGLEEDVAQLLASARDLLSSIEREHLYEECAYVALEDFLERALGPRPLLAAVVMMEDAADSTSADLERRVSGRPATTPSGIGAEDDPFAASFGAPPDASLPPDATQVDLGASPDPAGPVAVAEPPAPPPPKPRASRLGGARSTVALTVALALLAAVGGAVAARRGPLAVKFVEVAASAPSASASHAGQVAEVHDAKARDPHASALRPKDPARSTAHRADEARTGTARHPEEGRQP